jgi:hypothetical protein
MSFACPVACTFVIKLKNIAQQYQAKADFEKSTARSQQERRYWFGDKRVSETRLRSG